MRTLPWAQDVSHLCGLTQSQLAAQLLSPADGRLTCSVVVRLAQPTLRLLGYQSFCGPYATTTDAQAAMLAEAAMIPSATLRRVGPSMPVDAHVFYAPPSDLGGVVVVSARLARMVFAASEVYGGVGQIRFPTAWLNPAELGDGCGTGVGIPRAHGFNLGVETAMESATVDRVVGALTRTMLPGALAQRGTLFDAVVLGYEPNPGRFDDEPPEWIVVVNAGWNE